MTNNKSSYGGNIGKLAITVILYISIVLSLQAGETDYGLGYLATHSDNITRVSSNERSDWIHSLLAGIAYQENSVDLVARVLAQAEFNNYKNSTYGDQALYYVNSSAVWTLSPQRYFWTVEDTARQALINSAAVDTPANRANVNVLSTGPDFIFRFSPVQTLALGARVGDVYTGRADSDNKRFNGSVGWLYQASSVTTYSLNYQAVDAKFDNSTLNGDFTRQDVFVRGEYRPSRSRYSLDLGKSDINRASGNDLSGTLARLSWIRQLSPESTFGLSASREFTDTGTDLLAASQISTTNTVATTQPIPATVLTTDVLTSDVYLTKREDIFYNYRSSQFGVQFQANQRNLDFETTLQDRKETNGSLVIDYFYSGATTASVFTVYTKTKYMNFVRQDTDRDSGIRVSYRITRTISLGLEGRRTDRATTDVTQNYVDNRLLFSVLYSSGVLFTPVPGR
jgi:hypothetical protein